VSVYVVGPIVDVGVVVGTGVFGVAVVACKQGVLRGTRFVIWVDRVSG
jgi:hypothetical protein